MSHACAAVEGYIGITDWSTGQVVRHTFVVKGKTLCDRIALRPQPQDKEAPMIVWEKVHSRWTVSKDMPVLLRRGVLASLSGALAGLSGTLLRRAAKDLVMALRGDATASGLSFFGFFQLGRQLFLTWASSTGSATSETTCPEVYTSLRAWAQWSVIHSLSPAQPTVFG